jgi:hypothetical protein
VEKLVDDWLAAHPEHPPLVHLEDLDTSPVDAPEAQAAASIGATDPGAIPDGTDADSQTEPASAGRRT